MCLRFGLDPAYITEDVDEVRRVKDLIEKDSEVNRGILSYDNLARTIHASTRRVRRDEASALSKIKERWGVEFDQI